MRDIEFYVQAYRGQIYGGSITGNSVRAVLLQDVKSLGVHDITVGGNMLELASNSGTANYNNFLDIILTNGASVTTVGANSVSHNNITGAP